MPKRSQFVRFYPADFAAAVAPYPVEVAGAYMAALCKYWEAGGVGLPDDLLKATLKSRQAPEDSAR